MEMSRQRLRQGVVEVSTMPCPICQGVGHIRSTESVALMVLRSIEDHLRTQGAADLTVAVSTEGALYILNHKRAYLRDIEMRYGVSIVIQMDENAHGGTFTLTRGSSAHAPALAESKAIHMEPSQAAASDGDDEEEGATEAGDEKRPLRRKRRRRRGGRGEASSEPVSFQNGALPAAEGAFADDGSGEEDEAEAGEAPAGAAAESVEQPSLGEESTPRNGGNGDDFRRNRRRGRRGGRRHRDEMGGSVELGKPEAGVIPGLGEQPVLGFDLHFPRSTVLGPVSLEPAVQEQSSAPEPVVADAPVPVQAPVPVEAAPQPEPQEEPVASPVMAVSEAAPEPAFDLTPEPEVPALAPEAPAPATVVQAAKPKPVKAGPRRKGWWQQRAG
jgi:ribonuclease E